MKFVYTTVKSVFVTMKSVFTTVKSVFAIVKFLARKFKVFKNETFVSDFQTMCLLLFHGSKVFICIYETDGMTRLIFETHLLFEIGTGIKP